MLIALSAQTGDKPEAAPLEVIKCEHRLDASVHDTNRTVAGPDRRLTGVPEVSVDSLKHAMPLVFGRMSCMP